MSQTPPPMTPPSPYDGDTSPADGGGRLMPREQCAGDLGPLLRHRNGRYRLAGAAVPVGGIRHVALLVMQMCVHPPALGIRLGPLHAFVRLVPVPLCGPPPAPHRTPRALQ